MKIQNPYCEVSSGWIGKDGAANQVRVSAGFEYKGARYHCWIDPETGAMLKLAATLFKNPPRGIGPTDPGYYRQRYLDATAGANIGLVAELMAAIDVRATIAAWIVAERAKEAKLRADRIAEEILEVKQAAAAEMYDALEKLAVESPALVHGADFIGRWSEARDLFLRIKAEIAKVSP